MAPIGGNDGYGRIYHYAYDVVMRSLPPNQRVVAIECVMAAQWRESKWFDGRDLVTLPPGSFVTSQDKLAERCGVGRQSVRAALANLRVARLATIRSTKHWTIITLTDHSRFKDLKDAGQPSEQPAPNQRPTTLEEEKKRRREEEETTLRVRTPARGISEPAQPEFFPEGTGVNHLPPGVETRPKRKRQEPHPDYPALRRRFTELYRTKTGSDPTWAAKQNSLAYQLLRKPGGLPEVVARAEHMFRVWKRGVPDIGSLVEYWDRLVPNGRAGPRSAEDDGYRTINFSEGKT